MNGVAENNQVLTVGIFKEAMEEIRARFEAADRKMAEGFAAADRKLMEGFEALDRKIDFVYDELSGKIDDLALTKADRKDLIIVHERVARLEKRAA
jgi:hypothetical protein